MRILYVINGFDLGGAEHGLLTLIEGGFFDGHELRVLGFCHGHGHLAEKIAGHLPPDAFQIAAKQESLSFSALAKGAVALLGILHKHRPELVVLSLKQANVVGRTLLFLFPGIRCASFEHIARYRARRAEGLYQYALRLLSPRVDEIWADCAETLAETRRYFSNRRRYAQIVPLFRADPGCPAKSDYAAHAPLRLVAAGRLISRKNFALLVNAIAEVRTSLDTRLDIFGDGEERAALEAQIDRLRLRDIVHIHGYAECWYARDEVLEGDIFVNVSDTEGFCITVAEAMAVGLPVVATDIGGIRDYGTDGSNMLKLATVDRDALIAALRLLAEDEALRRRLGQSARADMMEHYGPSTLRNRGRDVLANRQPVR